MSLNTCPPVLDYFQEHYRYICVDEAQDTSKIQHAINPAFGAKEGVVSHCFDMETVKLRVVNGDGRNGFKKTIRKTA